jgi:hypothetical protein
MEGGKLVAAFDPTIKVSAHLERSIDASDVSAGFQALAGSATRGLTEEELLRKIRVFYPDATREEAAFLMPAGGGHFTLEYVRTLLAVTLGPSFDPVAEAMRPYAPPHRSSHAAGTPEVSVAALRRIAGALLGDEASAALGDKENVAKMTEQWDADRDGRLGLEDVRAALIRDRERRKKALGSL